MKKLLPLLLLFTACNSSNESYTTLENLESIEAIALDEQDRILIFKKSPASYQKLVTCQALDIQDISVLAQVGINDHFVLDYLKFTKKTYNLSEREVHYMQRSGVSQNIIHYLLTTGE